MWSGIACIELAQWMGCGRDEWIRPNTGVKMKVTADSVPNDVSLESEEPETQDGDTTNDENSPGHIASTLAQRSLEDEDATDAVPVFNDIPLQQFFNCEDESWMKLTEAFGMSDDELEFYELVTGHGEDEEQTFVDDMI